MDARLAKAMEVDAMKSMVASNLRMEAQIASLLASNAAMSDKLDLFVARVDILIESQAKPKGK